MRKMRKMRNYFVVNGRKINKYQTLEENGIKNNDVITLFQFVDNYFLIPL